MTRVLPNCGMAIDLDFTKEFYASKFCDIESDTTWDSFREQCFKLKGIVEVCTDHQVWVRVEPKSRTWEGIAAETRLIDKKVRAIIARGK